MILFALEVYSAEDVAALRDVSFAMMVAAQGKSGRFEPFQLFVTCVVKRAAPSSVDPPHPSYEDVLLEFETVHQDDFMGPWPTRHRARLEQLDTQSMDALSSRLVQTTAQCPSRILLRRLEW